MEPKIYYSLIGVFLNIIEHQPEARNISIYKTFWTELFVCFHEVVSVKSSAPSILKWYRSNGSLKFIGQAVDVLNGKNRPLLLLSFQPFLLHSILFFSFSSHQQELCNAHITRRYNLHLQGEAIFFVFVFFGSKGPLSAAQLGSLACIFRDCRHINAMKSFYNYPHLAQCDVITLQQFAFRVGVDLHLQSAPSF